MANNTNLSVEDLNTLASILTELENANSNKGEQKKIMAKLMDFFRTAGIKTYHHTTPDGVQLTLTFVDEYETSSFDASMLKDKYPEIWEECHTIKKRPANIAITKKKGKAVDPDDGAPSDEELSVEAVAQQIVDQTSEEPAPADQTPDTPDTPTDTPDTPEEDSGAPSDEELAESAGMSAELKALYGIQ